MLKVQEPPKKAAWDNFYFYARRVHSIRTDRTLGRALMSRSSVQQLLRYVQDRADGPLFPNLRSLDIYIRHPADARLLALLVGPRLSSISLQCFQPNAIISEQLSICDSLGQYPSAVRRLEVVDVPLDLPLVVRPMHGLEDLGVRGIQCSPSRLLAALANARSLCRIILRQPSATGTTDTGPFAWPEDLFTSLREADATHLCLPALLSPTCIPSRLLSLSLSVFSPRKDVHDTLKSSLRLIGSTCSSLQKLAVRAHKVLASAESSTAEQEPGKIDVLSIRPLLRLHNLTELSVIDINGSVLPDWNEADLPPFASSWPRITTVIWKSRGAMGSDNLSVLDKFSSCGALKDLAIPLDATILLPDDAPRPFAINVKLDVSDWTINTKCVDQVAHRILQLSPNVEDPLGIWVCNTAKAHGADWKMVKEKMQLGSSLQHSYPMREGDRVCVTM